MKLQKLMVYLTTVLSLGVILAACSGGGGSSSGGGSGAQLSAMVVADQVSVVDAKDTENAGKPNANKISALLMGGLHFAALPAESDFNKDQTNVYVHERSVEMFGIVNEILCMISQTRYDQMLNKGPYKAQIDENQCSSEKGDASQDAQSNQSSGSTAPSYVLWTVESSRADENSPQIVKAWIHEEASEWEPAQIIKAKVTITEGKSETNPYGIFTVQFKATPPDNPNMTLFRGTLLSERDALDPNVILLKFVDGTPEEDPYPRAEAVTLNRSADGSVGSGTGYRMEVWDNQGTPETHEFGFDIAYNTDYFLRSDGTKTVCLNRNDHEQSAWRYGLYDENGARVKRNSGFPIKKDGKYGWVGYWGFWLPQDVTIVNGDTVNKHDYATNTDTPYTVFVSQGKLKKHTKKSFTLAEVNGIPLDFWDNGANYRVAWDGTNFNKIAQMPSNCTNNCTWADITTQPTPTINFSQVQWSELNFWSQSLGGQVRVPLASCSWQDPDGTGPDPGFTSCSAPTDATNVIFYQEDIVYPTDIGTPTTLACYDQCPKAASSSGIDMTDPTHNTWDQNTGLSTAHTYSFDKDAMLLKDDIYSAVLTTTGQQYQWGFMSGPLFAPTQANLDLLACDWNPAQTCGWKAWSALSVFYTWETGLNNWNRFSALKDGGGAFVKFDPPLQVSYTHTNGAKYYLQYSGFGELQGIPGKCMDMDSGAPISCDKGGEGNAVRWVPEFTITAGSTLSDDSSNDYLAKPLDMEQRMKSADSSVCTGQGLSTQTYDLPVLDDEWSDPGIDTEPVVTAAPAVVGGIVQ